MSTTQLEAALSLSPISKTVEQLAEKFAYDVEQANPNLAYFLTVCNAIKSRKNITLTSRGAIFDQRLDLTVPEPIELEFSALKKIYMPSDLLEVVRVLNKRERPLIPNLLSELSQRRPEGLVQEALRVQRIHQLTGKETDFEFLPKLFFLQQSGRYMVENKTMVRVSSLLYGLIPEVRFSMILPERAYIFECFGQLWVQIEFDQKLKEQFVQQLPGDFMAKLMENLRLFSNVTVSVAARLGLLPGIVPESFFVGKNDHVKIVGVPLRPREQIPPEYLGVFQLLKLEYAGQFLFLNMMACYELQLAMNHRSIPADVVRRAVQQRLYSTQVKTYLRQLPQDRLLFTAFGLTREVVSLVYFLCRKTHHQTQQLANIISFYKCGFLPYRHPTFRAFSQGIMTYIDLVRFDQQTTLELFLQVIQTYFSQQRRPEETLFKYLLQRIPKMEPFLEAEPLEFNTKQTYVPDRFNASYAPEESPRLALLSTLHEFQHLRRTGYKATLYEDLPVLPQLLADCTSVTPVYNMLKFVYQDQVGIDAGGLWRQVLSTAMDEVIGGLELTPLLLEKVKEYRKFAKSRELDFATLSEENPNPHSLVKPVHTAQRTVLVPHYNGYVPQSSSLVFPRLTEKRSAIYYFGRLLGFMMVCGTRMPNFLHANFWDALTGGQFYFTEQLREKFKAEMLRDKMFTVNGTRGLASLAFPLSQEELSLYYQENIALWTAALEGADAEFLCLQPGTLKELQRQKVNILESPEALRLYAKRALADLAKGLPFAKTYCEFRNGFRHSFGDAMMTKNHPEHFLEFSQRIDSCLCYISAKDLEEILTFNPEEESYMDRDDIVQRLFADNEAELQSDERSEELHVYLETLKATFCSGLVSHKQLLDFVYAATGQRALRGTSIRICFQTQGNTARRLLQFHTCFNRVDIPLEFFATLMIDEVAAYITESVTLALANGFSMQ